MCLLKSLYSWLFKTHASCFPSLCPPYSPFQHWPNSRSLSLPSSNCTKSIQGSLILCGKHPFLSSSKLFLVSIQVKSPPPSFQSLSLTWANSKDRRWEWMLLSLQTSPVPAASDNNNKKVFVTCLVNCMGEPHKMRLVSWNQRRGAWSRKKEKEQANNEPSYDVTQSCYEAFLLDHRLEYAGF